MKFLKMTGAFKMNEKSIFGRIIPFLAGIAVLLVLFPYSKKLNLDAEVFKFLWILVIEIYLLVFIPIFITAFIPKDIVITVLAVLIAIPIRKGINNAGNR